MQRSRLGRVIWITGLSAAGKSTVAAIVVERLKAAGERPILLDGDALRTALGTQAFDRESRRRLGFAYARLCRLLAEQGHTVVCATIALHHDLHAWNREHLPGYTEVFLDVPLGELVRRDSKSVYADGREVVGVGLAAELPTDPHLVLRTYGATTPEVAAAEILELVG